MRTRLTIILFVPGLALLLLLGMAYVTSAARAEQQRIYVDRLRDASYLTITARESMRAGDPDIVEVDLARYREVYGVDAGVLTRNGSTWATNGIDLDGVEEYHRALSGRRSEPQASVLPWHIDHVHIAEPIYDGGDLVGAVVTTSDIDHIAGTIWRSWALLLALGLLLAGLAHFTARRTADWVLRPVRRVNRAMSRMGSGQLGARIPDSVGPPELQGVTARFNEMAEQVETLVRKQREFVHNASHELRNPLTALTLRVEGMALTAPPDQAEEITAVRAETVRLRQILDALLLLADDASVAEESVSTDLAALVEERVKGWRLLAPGRSVSWDRPAGRLPAVVNPTAVECALDTVIDNALKFSPATEPIEVGLDGDEETVTITVRDHGPGMPTEQLTSATERFWRAPEHQSVRGSGLGLAIAHDLLKGLGGGVSLELPDGGGLQVRLQLPAGGDR